MAKPEKARGRKAGAAKKVSRKPTAIHADPTELPSFGKLQKLLSNIKSAEADKNESVGRIGNLISQAVDKDNVDKVALSMARRLERMSANKGSTAWLHLPYYIKALGLEDRWTQQAQMFDRDVEVQEAAESVREASGTSPAKLPRAGSFADKVRQQQGLLTNPRLIPTADQVKEIADRAEQGSGKPN